MYSLFTHIFAKRLTYIFKQSPNKIHILGVKCFTIKVNKIDDKKIHSKLKPILGLEKYEKIYGNKFKVPPKKLKFGPKFLPPKILLGLFHNFYD